jgi:hypothetical protein
LFSVPKWLESSPGDIEEEPSTPATIKVRFINTIDGKDVIANANAGDNLLNVGDKVGVKLPRACRTGLCASCTCDVQDPNAQATASNPRDGFVVLRACSTKCFVPEGMEEMVVDVYRMKKTANAAARRRAGVTVTEADSDDSDYVSVVYELILPRSTKTYLSLFRLTLWLDLVKIGRKNSDHNGN